MAGKGGTTYEGIMSDLRAGKYLPVYILMGEEAYYIDKISDYIAENALTPDERDFNLSVVFGLDVQASQIVDRARRYPLMAERQVVIVKEAQNIKDWDSLELYVEKPVKSTVLVICYKNGTIDRRKKIISKAAAQGVVFVSEKKHDNDLPFFIENYVKTNSSATIDEKAVTMLREHIGTDLNRMASELDKLFLALPENDKRITPEIVEDKIGISKDFNAFELKDAIVKRNIKKANQIVDYFKDNPKAQSVYLVIPALFSYFQNLLIAYYAPQPYRAESVADFLGLKRGSKQVWDYVAGMRNYNGNKVIEIISKLREMDAKSKGLDNPNTPIGELLKELVFFILH